MQQDAWQLGLLGPAVLFRDSSRVHIGRRKSIALLAYLALTPRWVTRESLTALLWPDLPAVNARAALRSSLSVISRRLDGQWLMRQGGSLRLNPDFPLTLDVDALEVHGQSPSLLPLDTLIDLQGEFLEGLHLEDCDIFQEWLHFHREKYRQAYLTLVSGQLQALVKQEAWPQVEAVSDLLLSKDPLSETACAAKMQLFAREGDVKKALQLYRSMESSLQQELGVSPGKALQTLRHSLASPNHSRPPITETSPLTPERDFGDIGYTRSDDLYLAYRVMGSGPRTLVVVWGFVSHLDQLFEESHLRDFFVELSRQFRIILFDKRHMGLSDRQGRPPTAQETARDVIALLNHLDIEKAWLLGVSEGGPATVECSHAHPDRIVAQVLCGTTAKWTACEDYSHSISTENYEKWLNFLEENWGNAVNLEHFAPSCKGNDQMVKWWAKTLRLANSPGAIRATLEAARDADVRKLLPEIRQPSLIVQKENDRLVRRENGRYLARHLANAEYLELPGADHWFWVADTSAFFERLEGFIQTVETTDTR